MWTVIRTTLVAAALMPAAWTSLGAQVGSFRVEPGGVMNISQSPMQVTNGSTIAFTCAAAVDCNGLDMDVKPADGGATQAASVTQGGAPGTLLVTVTSQMLGGGGGTLIVSGTGTAGGQVPLTLPPPPAPVAVAGNGAVSVATKAVDIGSLLTRDCSHAAQVEGELYEPWSNRAQFVVTPLGNVLRRPGDLIDENDRVVVHVVGDAQVVPRLVVSRASAFRTPGQVHFVGQGQDLGVFKGANDAAPIQCVMRSYEVHDLAPGEGEIKLEFVDQQGKREEVGRFDFGVHTLYAGAFSFGPIRTELRDPKFGTVERSDRNVVTMTEDGTPRVLYVLSFTPFMWGRRELEEPDEWYTHINPTIGIVPANVQKNAILGLSIDVLNSFYLQGGVHAGRVRRLDPRSGLRPGDEFTGTGDVPTVQEWDADWFVGLTVDLRAAVEFLRIAATGAGGG